MSKGVRYGSGQTRNFRDRHRPTGRSRSSSLGRWGEAAQALAPGVAAVAVLLALVSAALSSLPGAILCIAALGVTLFAVLFGAARVGAASLMLGYGMVTFDSVHLAGSIRLADPFFVLGFSLLLPRLVSTRLRAPTPFTVGALALAAIGLVAAASSAHPVANLTYFAQVVKGAILIPVLLMLWRPSTKTITGLAFTYLLGNSINMVASLVNGPDSGGRYAGLSSAPNLMGYGQALGLALVPFLVSTLPRKCRWIVAVLAAACTYGIYISGSRAALLGAVALMVLYPAFRRSIPAALGVGALIAPAMIIVSNVSDNSASSSSLGRLLGGDSGQASNDVRAKGAAFGIHQFVGNPILGGGWPTIWGVHIGYLQIAAAIGIFGLVAYLLLFSSLLRPLLSLPSPYRLLAVPALTAAMLDFVLPIIGALFEWTVIGLALCAVPLAARRREEQESAFSSAERRLE